MCFSAQENIEDAALSYEPPEDKSISIRAILLAAFANGTSKIEKPLFCDDTQAAINCIKQLGAKVDIVCNTMFISAGNLHKPDKPLYCGSSGTVARLLCGLLAGSGIEAIITGSEQLSRRPMKRITEPLRLMGANIDKDNLPIHVKPSKLCGITYSLPVASAQVKTALLFAAAFASGKTIIKEQFQSRNHGENILKIFSVPVIKKGSFLEVEKHILQPCEINIPKDFSSAAFFIAGAQVINKPLFIKNVGLNPTRLGLLEVLNRAGAVIRKNIYKNEKEPYGSLLYMPKPLNAGHIKASEIPMLIDEIPLAIIMFAALNNTTIMEGLSELKLKESDRLASSMELVSKMGAKACYESENLYICGPVNKNARFTFDANNDHRMAMTASIASLICPKIKIKGAACISKSYPNFFKDFKTVFNKLPSME